MKILSIACAYIGFTAGSTSALRFRAYGQGSDAEVATMLLKTSWETPYVAALAANASADPCEKVSHKMQTHFAYMHDADTCIPVPHNGPPDAQPQPPCWRTLQGSRLQCHVSTERDILSGGPGQASPRRDSKRALHRVVSLGSSSPFVDCICWRNLLLLWNIHEVVQTILAIPLQTIPDYIQKKIDFPATNNMLYGKEAQARP